MNKAVNTLYAEYLDHTGGDWAAAASLTLAAVMVERSHTAPPPTSLTAAEVAARLRINPKTIYAMCRDRRMRCYQAGRSVRIPAEEIECFEHESGARDPARASRTSSSVTTSTTRAGDRHFGFVTRRRDDKARPPCVYLA